MGSLDIMFLLGVAGAGYLAAKEKAFWNMRRSYGPVSSPLAKAVGQLVGIAGGIYLALDLLTTFLSVDIPEQIRTLGFNIDPLAVFSILMALVQPYLTRFETFIKKRRS